MSRISVIPLLKIFLAGRLRNRAGYGIRHSYTWISVILGIYTACFCVHRTQIQHFTRCASWYTVKHFFLKKGIKYWRQTWQVILDYLNTNKYQNVKDLNHYYEKHKRSFGQICLDPALNRFTFKRNQNTASHHYFTYLLTINLLKWILPLSINAKDQNF